MSTKIYGGRIARGLGLQALLAELNKVKTEFTQMANKLLMEKILNQAYRDYYLFSNGYKHETKFFLEHPGKDKTLLKEYNIIARDKNLKPNQKANQFFAIFFIKALETFSECYKNNLKCEYDFTFDICVYAYPGKRPNTSLLVIFPQNNQLEEKFDNLHWVEDYHYQNSTDGPLDVSARQWKKRIDVWDKATNGKRFDSCAYVYHLISKNDLINFYPIVEMLKEFKVKINKEKIADDIFHTIEFRRLVNQLKAKRRRKGIKDTFEVSDIYPIQIEIANLIKNKHPRFIQEKQKILQKLKSINLTT